MKVSKSRLLALFSAILFLLSINVFSQNPGSLDLNFNGTGIVTTNITQGDDDVIRSIVVRPDGKIIAAGYTLTTSSNVDVVIARYNPDGSLDNSFGNNGIVVSDLGNQHDYFYSVALTPSGKIVAGGRIHDGVNQNFLVVRFLSDGTFDNTFGNNGVVFTDIGNGERDGAYSILVQPDGKIIAAGYVYDGTQYNFALARYKTDGSLDNTFSYNGIVTTDLGNSDDDIIYGITLQADLKIVVTGHTNLLNSNLAIARYMPDGLLDNTFNSNGIVITDIPSSTNEQAYAVASKTNGKILITGRANIGGNYRFILAQYTSDGALDNSFGTSGYTITNISPVGNSVSRSIGIQDDEKILLAGYCSFSTTDIALVRYLPDGTPDNEFGNNGIVFTDYSNDDDGAFSLAIQPDLKILVAGTTDNGTDNDFIIARYHSGLHGGIENNYQSVSEIKIFPIPFSNSLYLTYTLERKEYVQINIFNARGKMVTSLADLTQTAGQYKIIQDLSYLPAGVYYVKFDVKEQSVLKKIIKID